MQSMDWLRCHNAPHLFRWTGTPRNRNSRFFSFSRRRFSASRAFNSFKRLSAMISVACIDTEFVVSIVNCGNDSYVGKSNQTTLQGRQASTSRTGSWVAIASIGLSQKGQACELATWPSLSKRRSLAATRSPSTCRICETVAALPLQLSQE